MARSSHALGSIAHDTRWTKLRALPEGPYWTDDFSDIVGVLTFE
jgi:hypothetical protein